MSEKKQNWLTRLFGGKEQEPPPDDEGKAAPQKVDVGQTMPADTGRNVLASPPNDPQQPEPAEAELRADALNSRGVSLLNSSKPEEALEVFERALTVEPGHPECLYNRGLLLWRRGKLTDEALLALLKETTAQTDTSIQGNYLVGLVHLERGDFEGAVKHLEAACADGEPSLDAKTALKQARTLAKASTHVQTFEGDESPESVVFSSDGSWALSGSFSTLRLWKVATGRCVRTFERHKDLVTSVAFSADGCWALSGSHDKTLRLWEVASGHCVRTFEGHTDAVRAVALSPDNRWALSGSDDETLRLWEVSGGGCVRIFNGHTKKVMSVSLSANGRWALSGSWDDTLRLWELATGRCVRTLEGHTSCVSSVALSADDRWALSGSWDDTLRLWELATGCCVRTFQGHKYLVTSVALSADGRWALSGSWDKTLRLWELATGRCIRTFEGHADHVESVALSADCRWAISGSCDKTLRLWELPKDVRSSWVPSRPISITDQLLQANRYKSSLHRGLDCLARQERRQAVTAAREALSCSGYRRAKEALDLLSRASHHGTRQQLRDGFCRFIFSGHTDSVWSVAFSADGRWVLSGSSDKTLRLWEVSGGGCVRTFEGHTKSVTSVALSADGRWALSGSQDKTLRLWELVTGRCVRSFGGPSEHVTPMNSSNGRVSQIMVQAYQAAAVTSVAFSADGCWVLSGNKDKRLRLSEVASGWCARTFKGHKDFVWSVAISADGRWALSGGEDNKLRLSEVATGRPKRAFEGHTSCVSSVAPSSDGRFVLSGSWDKTLRLWELSTGHCVRTFEGHIDGVTTVALSADGRWAFSGSCDKTLRLWEVASGRCVRTFEGHTDTVRSVALSPDNRWAVSGSDDKTIRLWDLDWECDFPDATDWDEGARPHLNIFLSLHRPMGKDGFSRYDRPAWTDEDFNKLLTDLQYRGYGWLRPEGVRRQLEKMNAEWQPPSQWEVA